MWQGNAPFDLRKTCGYHAGNPPFFLPAGIRPVKGNLECLPWFERIHRERPAIRAVFASSGIDSLYAAEFENKMIRCSAFAKWISPIPPIAMQSAYQSADVVLNTSLSEGLSNTLLEAIAAGRPLLAADIPGNRWPVLGDNGDRPCGLLFDRSNPEDFIRKAIQIIDDEVLRQALTDACVQRAADFPLPADEAGGLDRAYRSVLYSRF